MPEWTNPDDAALEALLRRARTLAIVGASPDPARPSHQIMRRLQQGGFRTLPVRPAEGELFGERYVPALGALPGPVDVVVVFRAPRHVPALVDELLREAERLGRPALWLQDGVIAPEAAARARAAGLTVVMDDCLWRVWGRLVAPRPGRGVRA